MAVSNPVPPSLTKTPLSPTPIGGSTSSTSAGSPASSVSGSQSNQQPRGYGAYGGGEGMINPYAAESVSPAGLAAFSMPSQAADADQSAAAAQSPAINRLSTPTATSSMPQYQGSEVWVTVPVDKVEVMGGKGTVTPVYGTEGGAGGYHSPTSGNAIPPTPAVGRTART